MRLLTKLFPKRKPEWAALCSVAFTDKKGRRYYKYNDELDMNILRKGEIEKYQLELRYGSDMEDVCEAMKVAVGSSDKKGNMTPDVGMIGYLTQELLDRKEMLLLPDILFKILATTLIREDESPSVIDEEILEEKLITFKEEIQSGGLFPFFQSGVLLRLTDLSNISIIDFKRLMTESQQRIQNLNRVVFSFESRLQPG